MEKSIQSEVMPEIPQATLQPMPKAHEVTQGATGDNINKNQSDIFDASAQSKPIKRSFGEKAFDWLVYGVWNHGVNLVLSAAVTYWARETGARGKMVNKLTNKGMGEAGSGLLVDTLALSMGGNLTAMGVKPVEDKKVDIVKAINKQFSPEEENTPLADTSKQTWFSVISGRLTVLVGVTLAMMTLGQLVGKKTLPDGKKISRLQIFEEKFGEKLTKFLTGKTHKDGQPTRLFKMNKVLALETIAVTLGSFIFYGASKMFSKKSEPEAPTHTDVAVSNAVQGANGISAMQQSAEKAEKHEIPAAQIATHGHQHEMVSQVPNQALSS